MHVCCSSCIRICYRLLYASFFLNQLESEKNRLENLLSSNLLKRKEELQRVRNTLIVKLHICTRVFTLFLCACVLTCMFARVYNSRSVQPPYGFHLDSKGGCRYMYLRNPKPFLVLVYMSYVNTVTVVPLYCYVFTAYLCQPI